MKRKLVKFTALALLFYFGLILAVTAIPQKKLVGRNCLPPKLQDRPHDDYALPGTRWIPRSATSWCFVEPPKMILGNQKSFEQVKNKKPGPKPIPRPGEWQFSLIQVKNDWPLFIPYFALTTKNGSHFRIGCRWDDVDHYYVLPSIGLKLKSPPFN